MPRRRPDRLLLAASAALSLAALAPGARAQTFTQSVAYSKTGQSMWGTSAAPPVTGSWSFDHSWNKSASIDGIAGSAREVIIPGACIPFVGCSPDVYGDTRTGAKYTAYTSGRTHFDASATFSGGSVDIGYRASTAVTVKNGADHYFTGERVTLSSSWTPANGSSFITTAPTYSAEANLGFGLTVGAKGTVCSFGAGCDVNGGDIFSFDTGDFELAALNPTGDGSNRILGLNAPGMVHGKPITPGDIVFGATRALSVTSYYGDASAYSDLGSGVLQARGNALLMFAALDPVALAANHIGMGGFCALSCSAFGLGYELQGTRFGPVLGYRQDFEFEPASVATTYTFDTPVQARVAPHYVMVADTTHCSALRPLLPHACRLGRRWVRSVPKLVTDPWSAPTTSITVPTGVDIEIEFPWTNGAPVGVQTSFAATGSLRNTSRLQVMPQFSYSLLSVTTPDGTLGPVYRKTFSPGMQNLGAFFDETFEVALGAQDGASFLLHAADPGEPIPGFLPGTSPPILPPSEFAPLAAPEPSTLALLAGGLVALSAGAARRRRVPSPT
jgi:hypothetical protein